MRLKVDFEKKLMECVLYLFTDDDLTVLLIPHSDLRGKKWKQFFVHLLLF